MTSKDIDKALRQHFANNSRYMVSNIYAFDSYYKEIDFLVVKESGIYYNHFNKFAYIK